MSRTPIQEAAKALIRSGRPVFPISGDKIPYRNCDDCRGLTDEAHREVCACLRNGRLCHGFYAATLDVDIFDSWCDEHPDLHMIAMPTGRKTGLFVMEYDPKNGGKDSYDRLIADHGVIQTETNQSPSGGLHHVFLMPDFNFGNIHGKLWPGIDIKGTGGYALMPPSETDKGSYSVVDGMDPQPAPQWLLDKIFEYQSANRWDDEAHILKIQESRDYDPDSITPEQAEHVQKTIEYWQDRIIRAEHGEQNILIYTGARVLFSLVFHGLLTQDDAQAALEEACERGNHPQHRSLLAIQSGGRAALSSPDPKEDALANDINLVETFTKDDIGNANRVIFWRGTDIRYDPDREKFFTWNTNKWVFARDGRVRNIVEDVHKNIAATETAFYSDISSPPSEQGKRNPRTYRDLFSTWAQSQRLTRKISDTMATLRGRDVLWCTADDFDASPYHLNVANGIVDLSSGELLPHDRSFMCSKISEVIFDPSAKAPEWERFVEMVMPDPEHRAYLQRLIGYSVIGEVVDQIFVLHIGTGGNGKGVLLDIISYIIGEYATTGQRDSFVRKSNSNRIPADIASMEGARLVVVDELNDNQKLDEALLKDITGGGTIKAEAKNINPWEYTPQFTLHFRTNHMPDLPSDQSIVRRFRPIKWVVNPTSEQWDTFKSPHHSNPFNYLTKKESSGILNWILEGTRDYLKHGLQVPDSLETEALMMLQENDPFLVFMSENIVRHEGAMLDGTKLYTSFKDWYKNHGFSGNPPSSRSLFKDLKEGKYKGRWEWGTERDRFTLKDVSLNSLLVK